MATHLEFKDFIRDYSNSILVYLKNSNSTLSYKSQKEKHMTST